MHAVDASVSWRWMLRVSFDVVKIPPREQLLHGQQGQATRCHVVTTLMNEHVGTQKAHEAWSGLDSPHGKGSRWVYGCKSCALWLLLRPSSAGFSAWGLRRLRLWEEMNRREAGPDHQ